MTNAVMRTTPLIDLYLEMTPSCKLVVKYDMNKLIEKYLLSLLVVLDDDRLHKVDLHISLTGISIIMIGVPWIHVVFSFVYFNLVPTTTERLVVLFSWELGLKLQG